MIALVTGGAGFIGSHLVKELVRRKYKVIVLDNLSTGSLENLKSVKNKIKFIKLDLSKNKKISKYLKGVDYVFHLAGLISVEDSLKHPDKYYFTNVIGTINLLNSLINFKIKKLIYAASASCYGFPDKFPTKEKSKIKPMYPYAFTKWQAEEILMHWVKIYNFPAISLRFFNCYGLRSRTSGAYGAVLGVFLAQKLAKKSLTIVGNGKQTRDFVHVKDLVRAVLQAASSKKIGEIYNVAGGKEITVNKIAKLIGGYKVSVPKRPGEPNRSLADISKIKAHLNWEPKISIDQGIRLLLKNISNWKEAPVWTPNSIKKATKTWFKLLSKS